MKALILPNGVDIQFRRNDIEADTRVSDHWLVSSNLLFYPNHVSDNIDAKTNSTADRL